VPTMEDVIVLRQLRWVLTATDEAVVDKAAVVMRKRRCLDHGKALALTTGPARGGPPTACGKRPRLPASLAGVAEGLPAKQPSGESVDKAGGPAARPTAVSTTLPPALTQQSILAIINK
jgi:hypothetical protein